MSAPEKRKKLVWMKLEQRVIDTPSGQVRITVEAEYDWHYLRTGQKKLLNVPKEETR